MVGFGILFLWFNLKEIRGCWLSSLVLFFMLGIYEAGCTLVFNIVLLFECSVLLNLLLVSAYRSIFSLRT